MKKSTGYEKSKHGKGLGGKRSRRVRKYEPRYIEAVFDLPSAQKGEYAEIRDAKYYQSKLRRVNAGYIQSLRNMKEKVEKAEKDQELYTEVLFPKYVSLCKDVQDAKVKLLDFKFLKKFMDKNKKRKEKKRRKAAERRLGKIQLKNKDLREELSHIRSTREKQTGLIRKAEEQLQSFMASNDAAIEKRMTNTDAKIRYNMIVKNRNKVKIQIEDLQSAIVTTVQLCKRLHGELYDRKNCFRYFTYEKEVEKKKDELAKARNKVKEKDQMKLDIERDSKVLASKTKELEGVNTEINALSAKAEDLHLAIGGCYLEDKDEFLQKNFEVTKNIMKLEHMKRLYDDRHRATQWYISMLLLHMSKGNKKDPGTEEEESPGLSSIELLQQRKSMIDSLRKYIIEHEVMDKTQPRITRALELIKRKTQEMKEKIDTVQGESINKIKEKNAAERSTLGERVKCLKERALYGRKRVEETSALYTEMMVELSQNKTTRLLQSLEQQIQYHTHINYHSKEALRDILRQFEREERRGKLVKGAEEQKPGATLSHDEKEDIPFAVVQQHWLLGGGFQFEKQNKPPHVVVMNSNNNGEPTKKKK
jgi:hypothetical protein